VKSDLTRGLEVSRRYFAEGASAPVLTIAAMLAVVIGPLLWVWRSE